MSESESDYDPDEIQIKHYLNNDLLSAIKQAKYSHESHSGIKRSPGHHRIRNKRQAVIEKRFTSYTGKHWDVNTDCYLERATRRMTNHAISKEVSKEQLRRVILQDEMMEEASSVLDKMNNEFWSILVNSKKRQKSNEIDEHIEIEQHMVDVQSQLIRRYNCKQLDTETEKERERRMNLLTAMKDKTKRTVSQENLLLAMVENNRRKEQVQTDLIEAFERYQEDEHEVDVEYDAAMFEILNESLASLTNMFSRQKSKRMSIDEQQRKVRDLRSLMKDTVFQENMCRFNKVMGNLKQVFDNLKNNEQKIEEETKRIAQERKICMQEQLVRRHAAKWVNFAFAKERQRQIAEFETTTQLADPFRDAVKLVLAKAQREMILQKFNGKVLEKRAKTPVSDESSETELTAYDKKVKNMRMKSRRKSCVVREDETE